MKPVDLVYEGREEALAAHRCMPKPFGCGEPVTEFADPLSAREYEVSALCQKCQDEVFSAEFDDEYE